MSSEKGLTSIEAASLSPVTPMEMISSAMSNGASVEQIEKLIGFAERMQANEARMAFNTAFAAFKAETIRIYRDKENTQYSKPGKPAMYTSLENMVATVTPFLSKHGLAHHWYVKQEGNIAVTCHLTHTMGHSVGVTMDGPPDDSGAKNKLQQIKSSITYLKVSTFESVCGLASAFGSTNDDANGSEETALVSDEQMATWLDYIEEADTVDNLKRVFTQAYDGAKSIGDKKAMAVLVKRKDARKAALHESA